VCKTNVLPIELTPLLESGFIVIIIAPTIANSNIRLAINNHILKVVYKTIPNTAAWLVSVIYPSQLLLVTNIILAISILVLLNIDKNKLKISVTTFIFIELLKTPSDDSNNVIYCGDT
jgi:hypothetical protein